MKLHFQRQGSRLTGVGLYLVLAMMVSASLLAQLSQSAVVRGFKFPESYETPLTGRSQTNRMRGLFIGVEGHTITKDLARFIGVRIEHFGLDGKTNMVVVAPEALFDKESRVAWSTGRLEIVAMSGAMRVRGDEGFQVRMTNSTLTISNRVRTVIRQDVVNRVKP